MGFWNKLLTGSGAAGTGPGAAGTGSGRGGALGTPSATLDESPPSRDQESNAVVSGGGLVGRDDDRDPDRAARQSSSSQAP